MKIRENSEVAYALDPPLVTLHLAYNYVHQNSEISLQPQVLAFLL